MEYFRYEVHSKNYVINTELNQAEDFNGEAIPVERRVRLSYGKDSQDYLNSGERDVKRMLEVLEQNNVSLKLGAKILDFGCGSARMLRWMLKLAPGCEYWGCDAESKSIVWAQSNLDSSLKLFTNVKEPHLPFEDNTFDYIYAGSVFSHIDDLADIWLLELRRIVKPGGVLFLTFQDEHSLEIINKQHSKATTAYYKKLYEDNNLGDFVKTKYSKIVIDKTSYTSQVFYSQEWLQNHLSNYYSSCRLVNEGYGWQTAAILKK